MPLSLDYATLERRILQQMGVPTGLPKILLSDDACTTNYATSATGRIQAPFAISQTPFWPRVDWVMPAESRRQWESSVGTCVAVGNRVGRITETHEEPLFTARRLRYRVTVRFSDGSLAPAAWCDVTPLDVIAAIGSIDG